MSRLILIPYKMGSETCKAIKEAVIARGFRCLRVRPDSRKFTPKRGDKIVYYGGGQPSRFGIGLNENRELAQNKLKAFQALQEADVSTVEWTIDPSVVAQWPTTVVRATLTGHSGQGITIIQEGDPIPVAPLYTKYMKKAYECRVHVFNGEVIDAQIKRKQTTNQPENTTADPAIRNIHTGWVYCRENFVLPEPAKELSIKAVEAVGLDFGAVDVIWNDRQQRAYVLAINSAPGLEGQTVLDYANYFRQR